MNNSFFITKEISLETDYIEKLLEFFNKFSAEETKENPLKIYINSPGGSIPASLAIYDIIRSYVCKGYNVNTIACGQISSCAVLIFLAGQHRAAYTHTSFFLHTPHTEVKGSKAVCAVETACIEQDALTIETILTAYTKDAFLPLTDEGRYIYVEEAQESGLIHEIL